MLYAKQEAFYAVFMHFSCYFEDMIPANPSACSKKMYGMK